MSPTVDSSWISVMSLEPLGLGRRRSWGITEWNRPAWLERCKISCHTLSSATSQGHVQFSTGDSLPFHKSCGFVFQYQPDHLLTLTLPHKAVELLDWCAAKSACKQGYQIRSAAELFFRRIFFFFLRLTSQKCNNLLLDLLQCCCKSAEYDRPYCVWTQAQDRVLQSLLIPFIRDMGNIWQSLLPRD